MDLHIYIHHDGTVTPPWAQTLLDMVSSLTKKDTAMGLELDNLTASVAASTTVQDSAMVLLTGLKTQLDAAIAGGNPAALQTLSDSLGAESTKLAAAIVTNTPAAKPGP